MEPPLKRPRLSIFADELPSAELDTARLQNDRHLKGRFEAIFQKYERDFAGLADEIDLSTGEIIVNNGHLAGLTEDADTRSEADESKGDEPPTPGSVPTPARRRPVTNGRSMLRAMTVAPDCGDVYFDNERADDVIESIETIAENAGLSDVDDSSSSDSGGEEDEGEHEDEACSDTGNNSDGVPGASDNDLRTKRKRPVSLPLPEVEELPVIAPDAADSDDDSLFEAPFERDSSPDSLFEHPTAKSSATPYGDVNPKQFFDSAGEVDTAAIIARFGHRVGQEVLDLIQTRDKAELHIEAAWRIPIHIEDDGSERASPIPASGLDRSMMAVSRELSTPKKSLSLWRAPGKSRLELHQDRTMTVIRAESEDPLQEGFVESGPVEIRVAEVSTERAVRLLSRGVCPFCKEQFFSMARAHDHLRSMLEGQAAEEARHDPHDADRIKELLSEMQMSDHNAVEDSGISGQASSPYRHPASEGRGGPEDSDDDLFVPSRQMHYRDFGKSNPDAVINAHPDASPPHEERSFSVQSPHSVIEIGDSSDEEEMQLEPAQERVSGKPRQEWHHRLPDADHPTTRTSSRDVPKHQSSGPTAPSKTDILKQTPDPDKTDKMEEPRSDTVSDLALRPRKAKKPIKYCFNLNGPAISRPRPLKERQISQAQRSPKGEKPFRCPVCPKQYKNPNGLQYHMSHSPRCNKGLRGKEQDETVALVTSTTTTTSTTNIVIAISSRKPKNTLTDATASIKREAPSRTSKELARTKQRAATLIGTAAKQRSAPASHVQNLAEVYAGFPTALPSQAPPRRNSGQWAAYAPVDAKTAEHSSGLDPLHQFTVADYRSIVVHHEGEGEDLDTFGEVLASHYYDYRLPVDPLYGLGSQGNESWTEFEDIVLQDLSLEPDTLMETIRRRLPDRTQFEIGNRLASYFLAAPNASAMPHKPGASSHHEHRGRPRKDRCTLPTKQGDNNTVPKDTKSPEPLHQRICREKSPSGRWRGCNTVYPRRAALEHHWEHTKRSCFESESAPAAKPAETERRPNASEHVSCRSTSPGGTVRGCGKVYTRKSSLLQHWRRQGGVACRPHDYATPEKARAESFGEVEEIPESDHAAAEEPVVFMSSPPLTRH